MLVELGNLTIDIIISANKETVKGQKGSQNIGMLLAIFDLNLRRPYEKVTGIAKVTCPRLLLKKITIFFPQPKESLAQPTVQ